MMHRLQRLLLSPSAVCAAVFLSVVVAGLSMAQNAQIAGADQDIFAVNKALGSGINLGNMLDAPAEGEWGVKFQDEYAQIIRNAGFRHVRLPVRWSAHTSSQAPYWIDPVFMKRVRHVVDTCLKAGLCVVLNVHHFEEIYTTPEQQEARLLAIWKQISTEFRKAPQELLFELLNEPQAELTTANWNRMIPTLLSEVRQLHPDRAIVIGGGRWNSFEELEQLQLPDNDRMLIATFHYYHPFEFTHQGVDFLKVTPPPSGRKFPVDESEVRSIKSHFTIVSQWAAKNKRPVYVGEFGVAQTAAQSDRARWIQTIASEASDRGFSLACWEFCSQFGLWSSETGLWNTDIIRALDSVASKQEAGSLSKDR